MQENYEAPEIVDLDVDSEFAISAGEVPHGSKND